MLSEVPDKKWSTCCIDIIRKKEQYERTDRLVEIGVPLASKFF
jgi:hypothetical protein